MFSTSLTVKWTHKVETRIDESISRGIGISVIDDVVVVVVVLRCFTTA